MQATKITLISILISLFFSTYSNAQLTIESSEPEGVCKFGSVYLSVPDGEYTYFWLPDGQTTSFLSISSLEKTTQFGVILTSQESIDTIYTEVVVFPSINTSQPVSKLLKGCEEVILEVQIDGGKSNDYIVTGLDGTISFENNKANFTSAPIKCQTNYQISIDDQSTCQTTIVSGITECDAACKVYPIISIDEIKDFNCTEAYQIKNTVALDAVSAMPLNHILWKHNGKGTFSDSTALNPIYYPDSTDCNAPIRFNLIGYSDSTDCKGFCPDAIDSTTTNSFCDLVNAGPDDVMCFPEEYQLNTSIPAFDQVFINHTSNGTIHSTNEDTTTIFTPGVSDCGNIIELILNVNFQDQFCRDIVLIDVQCTPSIYVGEDAILCSNCEYQVSDVSVYNYSSVHWTHNGFGTLMDSLSLTPTYQAHVLDTALNGVTLTLEAQNENCSTVFDTIVLSVFNHLSTPSFDQEKLVDISYNQLSQELNFLNHSQNKFHLFLYDSNGKIIVQQNSVYNSNGINLSHLSKGIYFCEIRIGDQVIRKKIVK